ncbi:unnamed protein product [Gulo gulo]|uniref:Uncharacterized protein n=1 Tax=Gulo gulo TaxID=48420 RepID=A0A9X9LM80_GULGU|nr:unnamed protein product [Gulo gulo]
MFPNYSTSTSRISSPKMTMSIAKDRTCKSKWLRDTGRLSALPESSAQIIRTIRRMKKNKKQ